MAAHKKIKEHRARRRALLGATGVSTVAVALTVGSGSRASAATVTTWDKVAKCESSGNWHINTGNGYSGGLQFSPRTWSAYKLPDYPSPAYRATKAQQIRVAERVLKAQGPRAWPVCSLRAGLSRSGPAPLLRSQSAPSRSLQAPSAQSRAARAVAYAISKIGPASYLWGGNGPLHFDCSGLTSQAWLHAGVRIPRTAAGQLAHLHRVPLSQIRPGDLVVYTFRTHADHVAIYIGGGRTVDTASSHVNSGVGYSRLHRLGGSIAGVVRPYGSTAPPRPKAAPRVHTETAEGAQPVSAGTYTVRHGDWLAKIARAHKTTWRVIYNLNRDRIKDPDLIFPGQILRMPEGAVRM